MSVKTLQSHSGERFCSPYCTSDQHGESHPIECGTWTKEMWAVYDQAKEENKQRIDTLTRQVAEVLTAAGLKFQDLSYPNAEYIILAIFPPKADS